MGGQPKPAPAAAPHSSALDVWAIALHARAHWPNRLAVVEPAAASLSFRCFTYATFTDRAAQLALRLADALGSDGSSGERRVAVMSRNSCAVSLLLGQ